MAGLKPFLEPSEKAAIQQLYETWITQLNLAALMPKLITSGLISNNDRQLVETERTKEKKCDLIFFNVLMRSTYEGMSKVRKLLIETGVDTNVQLAKMLPTRGEFIDFTPPNLSTDAYSEQCTDATDEMHGTQASAMYEYPPADTGVSKSAGKAGSNLKSFFTSNKKESLKKISRYYGFKSAIKQMEVTSGMGRGLCVVIRNFSTDLSGYVADAGDIRYFFGEVLKYDIWEGKKHNLVDVNYDGFEVALNKVVDELKTNRYDRFFLFVLSHGDAGGIKMTMAGKGNEEEPEKRYKVEDIVTKFTHDKLPEMKDFPKCFIIQACRGQCVAKSAARGLKGLKVSDDTSNERPQPMALPAMAVGRDLLMCYPTEAGYYSWVSDTGSWFIRKIIEVFRDYYRSEHLLDMLVEVAFQLSEMHKSAEVENAEGARVQEERVCQMPHYVCTLTKKFYLDLP